MRIDRSVYQTFSTYYWPGNVRELKNTIESMVILCDNDIVTLKDIPERIRGRHEEIQKSVINETRDFNFAEGTTLKKEVENFEKNFIAAAVKNSQGDRNRAMELLGLTKRTFYRKIANYGIKIK